MKRLRIISLLLAMAALSFIAAPALAIVNPDSDPAAPEFNVYRNLLETGDAFFLIYANIPYATTPDEPIWQTFIWRLYDDAAGTTEVAAAVPYVFVDNGYGYNVTSMYMDSANFTASGITWGDPLKVSLSGNPAAFPDPPIYNYTIDAGDYSPLEAQADEQAELAARILVLATNLDLWWGLGTSYSLLSETETGTVLSIYGEAFFRGAIYGLQGLCPQVFAYVVSDIDLTERTFLDTYVVALQNQYAGTWVQTSLDALDTLFSADFSLAWMVVALAGCFMILIITTVISGDPWLGVLDFCFLAVLMTRLGFISLGILALFAAIAVVYDSSRIWGVFKS